MWCAFGSAESGKGHLPGWSTDCTKNLSLGPCHWMPSRAGCPGRCPQPQALQKEWATWAAATVDTAFQWENELSLHRLPWISWVAEWLPLVVICVTLSLRTHFSRALMQPCPHSQSSGVMMKQVSWLVWQATLPLEHSR